ncbi:MAG: hypothetical protein DRI86_02870 [Bacteroidetes bacterium]|nr:MAG: hypothetical protein DRI86_02870 [Bacteroidota bacterium]
MKAVRLLISNPQVPISVLLMLALMFIAIAKISAKDNLYSTTFKDSNKEEVKSEDKVVEVVSYVDNRIIKLYPIYN